MASTKRAGTNAFSFAVGEWRGKGRQGAGGTDEHDSVFICLRAPGGRGFEIMHFDDGAGGKVFYAEHLTISPAVGGRMKVIRKGFAYSDVGETLFVMREVAKKEGDGVKITPEPGSKNLLNNYQRVSREGPDGLLVDGSVKAGKNTWTFEYHFKRRIPGS